MVKLPWEKLTPFADFLRSLPSSHGRAGMDDEDEEDEDEMQAYEDSMQRLKVGLAGWVSISPAHSRTPTRSRRR